MDIPIKCPDNIKYTIDFKIQEFQVMWDNSHPDMRMLFTKMIPLAADDIKILEAQPKLPYKYPYSYESKDVLECDKHPTLPDGVTIPMLKKQLNAMAAVMKVKAPFPEIESSDYKSYYKSYYTIFYIILVVLVAFAVMYKMSNTSLNSLQYSNNPREISEYYASY